MEEGRDLRIWKEEGEDAKVKRAVRYVWSAVRSIGSLEGEDTVIVYEVISMEVRLAEGCRDWLVGFSTS